MAKRATDWFRTPTWPTSPGASALTLAAEPHLLSRRVDPADPRAVDPYHHPEKGDYTCVFAVGPVWVLVEFGDFSGRLEPIRVEVRGYAKREGHSAFPVTPSTLRHIRLAELLTGALQQRDDLVKDLLIHSKTQRPSKRRLERLDQARREAAAADRASGARRGPQRVETTRLFYDVVDAYIRACDAGSRKPNVDAAIEVFGSHHSSNRSRVVKYISRARQQGILARTTRGVSSGGLTYA